jgi:sugar (pentulose or hexulose) kinase
MSRGYLIGVDVGTQSAKVSVFDTEGALVCYESEPLKKLEIPAPDLAIHPGDDLWDSLVRALCKVMGAFNKLGRDPKEILGMGICIVRCCRALLKENGELAHPVINWMDKRLNDPYEWVPEYGDVRWVTSASGYITHRLTGETKDTCANYIGWWPMDDDTCTWSTNQELLTKCRIPSEMLFSVVKPGETLGSVTARVAEITGVPAGVPVVATAHDKGVEALGSGTLSEGTALISLGTYIGAMVHGRARVPDAKSFWCFQSSIPGEWLYECMGVRRGMWTVSWFVEQFGGDLRAEAARRGVSVEELLNEEGSKIPAGSDGLVTVHDWAPPAHATFRRGAFFGFDGRHTRAHMYRSLLEGIGLTLKNHIDPMCEELRVPLKKIVVSGGGAQSALLTQILSDIFGVPVYRNEIAASVGAGCAINAGVGIGAFRSYEEGIRKMVTARDTFTPSPENTKLYRDINENVYRGINRHFDPVLERLGGVYSMRRG